MRRHIVAAEDATILPTWINPFLCGALRPHKISTGIRWEPTEGNEDLYLELKSRSGLACKHAVHVVAGMIDADYRGEIIVCLENRGFLPYAVKAGDRIAQGLIGRRVKGCAKVRDGAEPRNQEGFGSTGETVTEQTTTTDDEPKTGASRAAKRSSAGQDRQIQRNSTATQDTEENN